MRRIEFGNPLVKSKYHHAYLPNTVHFYGNKVSYFGALN
jgi:hypothetical protein